MLLGSVTEKRIECVFGFWPLQLILVLVASAVNFSLVLSQLGDSYVPLYFFILLTMADLSRIANCIAC